MKRFVFVLGQLLVTSFAVRAQPIVPPAAHIDMVLDGTRTLVANQDVRGAARLALAAARVPGRPDSERKLLISTAVGFTKKLDLPLAEADVLPYRDLTTDTALSNPVRIEAFNQLSAVLLARESGKDLRDMNPQPAREALVAALSLPNLLPIERAAALTNIAKGWERELEWGKARETYAQIGALELPVPTKTAASRAIAEAWAKEGNREAALSAAREYNLDPFSVYQVLGDRAGMVASIKPILDDPAKTERERWTAFLRLPQYSGATAGDAILFKEAISLGQQYLPALLATDANRASVLLPKFKIAKLPSSLPTSSDPAFSEYLAWSGPLLLKRQGSTPGEYDLIRFKTGNALAALGRRDEFLEFMTATAQDQVILPRTRLWAKLLAPIGRDPKSTPVASPVLKEPGTGEDIIWAAREAARTAGRFNDEALSLALLDASEKLLAKPQPARITCRYLLTAPANVTSWLNSPLLKDAKNHGVLNRPYGDNLKFLIETDSAVTGRTAATGEGDTGDQQTDLYTACDESGIYIFLNAHDKRYRDVLEGLAQGGSFEMYLAPGPGQPYYTMLPTLPGGDSDAATFNTNYPGEGFRWPSRKEGTYLSVAEPTQDGFGLVIFFGWELFAAKLPSEGTRWQMESIRWTRSGGFSFGGSESVHNRSSFGDIEFQGLDPKAMTAIKRRIVTKALALYKQAIRIESPVGHWADPELADPEFFKAVVQPEIDRLNPFAARVTPAMTDADIDEIFREAVPAWINLEGRMAAARAQYLLAKRVGR